jgi:hypothetical protein
VTVTGPTRAGFVTVYASGAGLPTASNLNFVHGQTVPNLVIAPVGADGRVRLYNGSPGTVQLIADVSGYYLSQSLAPGPVNAPSAIGSPQSGVRLSWANPTADSYAGVMIRRAVGTTAPATPGAGTLVGDVVAPATGFLDTVGLSNGNTYTYALFAHDGTPKFASAATVQIVIPASVNDSYTVPAGQSLSVAAPGVLANDSSASATTLTAAIAASTSHGTVTLAGNGGFSYTPAAGYVGSDSFTYTASNGPGTSTPASVQLSITNQPPVLQSPGPQTNVEGDVVKLQVTATDPNPGDTTTFSVSGLPAGLAMSNSGSITGSINNGDAGASPYTVTITATDNHGASDSATLTWTVTAPSTSPAQVVGQWHMDETTGTTMVDSSGSGNDGALNNVALRQPGWLGTGFGFDGSSSYATVPNAPSLNPGSADFSFQVHLQFSSIPGHDYDIFRKGLSTSAGGDFKMEIFTTSVGAQGSCVARGSSTRASVTDGPDLADGQWHTLSCVKTSTSLELVVDGVTYSQQRSIGSLSNSDDLWFGAQAGADFYNGIMDEVTYRIG